MTLVNPVRPAPEHLTVRMELPKRTVRLTVIIVLHPLRSTSVYLVMFVLHKKKKKKGMARSGIRKLRPPDGR